MRWILCLEKCAGFCVWKSSLDFVFGKVRWILCLEKCAGFCVWKSEFESAPGPPTI